MTARAMHDDEVPTDAALVRRLLAAQMPQWAGLPVAPVTSSGTDNAVYRLGEELVARLPRIGWAKDRGAKEHAWLPRLARHLPLPVPVPLALGEPGEGYPWQWTVCPWLPGSCPAVGDPIGVDALAAFVRALHAIDASVGPPAGEHSFFRGSPLSWRDEPTRAAIVAVRDEVDSAAVTEAWERDVAAPAWSGAPVWVHGDLSPGNLLCVDGRLTGVLDFGGLGVGDPAVDLIVAWNLLTADAREELRARLPHLGQETWQRGRGWALSIALVQLPYYRERNPSLAAGSRHVIGEVLADLSSR